MTETQRGVAEEMADPSNIYQIERLCIRWESAEDVGLASACEISMGLNIWPTICQNHGVNAPRQHGRSCRARRGPTSRRICHLPFSDLWHDVVQVVGAIHHRDGVQVDVERRVQSFKRPIFFVESSDLHGVLRIGALHL